MTDWNSDRALADQNGGEIFSRHLKIEYQQQAAIRQIDSVGYVKETLKAGSGVVPIWTASSIVIDAGSVVARRARDLARRIQRRLVGEVEVLANRIVEAAREPFLLENGTRPPPGSST